MHVFYNLSNIFSSVLINTYNSIFRHFESKNFRKPPIRNKN